MKEILMQKSWPADEVRKLKVNGLYGAISVAGYDGHEIKLELMGKTFGWQFWTAGQSLQRFLDYYQVDTYRNIDVLNIDIKAQNGLLTFLQYMSIDIKIWLPNRQRGYEASLETNLGDISIENYLGELNFQTYTGALNLFNVRGEVNGKTQIGEVNLRQCRGDFRIRTTAGNLKATQGDGSFDLTAHGGNLTAHQLTGKVSMHTTAGNIKASYLNGDLRFHATMGNVEADECQGNVQVNSSMGNIRLSMNGIQEYIRAECTAGNIKLVLPLDQGLSLELKANQIKCPNLPGFQGIFRRNHVSGTVGSGEIRIEATANSGNIKLKRRQDSPIETVERAIQEETFTLPQVMFQFNPKGWLYSLGFCILLTYGFSAVLFFLLEQATNHEMRPIYTGIVLGYILNAVFTVLLVNFFARFINEKIIKPVGQYAILIAGSLILSVLSSLIMGIVYWQFMDLPAGDSNSVEYRQPMWVYLLIPPMVASLYYNFWQRSRQITRKISEQEFQLIQLEKMKTKAELDALQARINPHFLYNALNSIAGLVHEDADKAEKMTLLLSKLFRFTIGTKDQHFNTIRHEVEIATTYLEIEQVRFGDRLSFNIEVVPELLQQEIPRFLLQPLVENAIKHGISKVSTPGRIDIQIQKQDDFIVCSVADNGAPFPENFFAGYGLQSIQDKLSLLYGAAARLDIQNNHPKQVLIYIPC